MTAGQTCDAQIKEGDKKGSGGGESAAKGSKECIGFCRHCSFIIGRMDDKDRQETMKGCEMLFDFHHKQDQEHHGPPGTPAPGGPHGPPGPETPHQQQANKCFEDAMACNAGIGAHAAKAGSSGVDDILRDNAHCKAICTDCQDFWGALEHEKAFKLKPGDIGNDCERVHGIKHHSHHAGGGNHHG